MIRLTLEVLTLKEANEIINFAHGKSAILQSMETQEDKQPKRRGYPKSSQRYCRDLSQELKYQPHSWTDKIVTFTSGMETFSRVECLQHFKLKTGSKGYDAFCVAFRSLKKRGYFIEID